jgi:tRNA A-37 threonylcarbamoyl transferase component Bud32
MAGGRFLNRGNVPLIAQTLQYGYRVQANPALGGSVTGITSDDSRPAGMARELRPEDPRKLGPYWLLGRLGGGGMGEVFLGRSPGGRLIAVKVVRSELAGQAEFRQRFAREVAAAQKVSGLFTAPVVDADVDAPVPWLATAYVPGPSLADAITGHGPLPATPVLALAAGLAEGLGAIHAAGIVHRDLKPSNVLLADDGPRIIDFGISRAAEAAVLTGTGVVFGSAAFMSPEQARGNAVGPPSDVFSLGAVLTFAATGQGPFGTGSSATLLYRVVFTPPDTSGLPAELRPLAERCLAKDPEQRPSTEQLLVELNTAPPAAGWLPAPITQAFLSYPPAEPGPAAPTAAGDLPAQAVTKSAAPRSGGPDRKMPTVPPGDVPPPAAAGTEAPGDSRGGRRPARLRLGLAGAATAAALIIIFLIVAMTAHLPPFAKATLAPSSPAPATAAPVSTGPRPSPAAVSRAAVSPVTLPATYPVSLPATSPATSAATSPATPAPTSPVTPAPTSPVTPAPTTPATSTPTTPATSTPTTPATSTPTTPVTSTDTSPVTSTDTSPTG